MSLPARSEHFTAFCTADGTWIARCLRTGQTASGLSEPDALAELRRLLTNRKAA